MNIAVLMGRMTTTPELKTTPSGLSVTSFSIAVDRGYGENKTTDFINMVAWRQTAEFICKHFTKGSRIAIEGSIQTRKYQDREGNNRTQFEVVANNVHFVDSKNQEQKNVNIEKPQEDFTDLGDVGDDLPF